MMSKKHKIMDLVKQLNSSIFFIFHKYIIWYTLRFFFRCLFLLLEQQKQEK